LNDSKKCNQKNYTSALWCFNQWAKNQQNKQVSMWKKKQLTTNLHLVAIMNFNMWSFPNNSLLQSISIWKYMTGYLTDDHTKSYKITFSLNTCSFSFPLSVLKIQTAEKIMKFIHNNFVHMCDLDCRKVKHVLWILSHYC
jgi:hypothetical protein